jgi:DNA polymerase III gamma/tau subunit
MVTKVAKKEGITLEPASADLIALLAEGSFRDAHGILQKIISSSKDKKVSIEEVEAVTGAPRGELVNAIITALDEGDLKAGLTAVRDAVSLNADIKVLFKLLLEKLRAVLLLRYAPDLEKALEEEYSDVDFKFLKELSKKKESALNARVLDRLLEAYDKSGRSYARELPLELALVDLLASREDKGEQKRQEE